MFTKNTIDSKSPKDIKMLFWSVFAGSRGCINRVKIVLQLKKMPLNTNQLSERLRLDYKVVERHLNILEKHELVTKVGIRYGATYFVSPLLESNLNLFDEMTKKAKNCKDGLKTISD